ncbi:uncharacterized protein [Littorina saxatilis]|uniref:Uncharacterized protein n=1 Tax=Littorina saxatilis TaxID=31220 RepID=A0AAN9FV71_9CAEN
MLETHVPWLAEGYRVKLQQEEKDKLDSVRPDFKDSFVLCPEERFESYAGIRLVNTAAPDAGVPPRRVQSACSRVSWGGDVSNDNKNNSGVGGKEVGFYGLNGAGEEGETEEDRRKNKMFPRASSAAGRYVTPRPSSAFFRPNSPSAPPPPPPRPNSDRNRLTSKNRPSSAVGVSCDFLSKMAERIRPSSAVGVSCDFLSKMAERIRPSSAVGVSCDFLSKMAERIRPSSAHQLRPQSSDGRPPPAPTRMDPYTVRERRIQALHQAWSEDPRSGLHIGGPRDGPGPSPHMMDRHVRCMEQLRPQSSFRDRHAWMEMPERPHSAMRMLCGGDEGGGWMEEEWWRSSPVERDNMGRVQRYIDCHRPYSAPSMRKELEGVYRRSNGVRGRSAHFCNFVSKAGMHSRLEGAHARTGSDDEYGLDYTSEAKYQDLLAQWRRQRGLTGSGTEGRPGSPTSMDGRNGLRDVNDDDAMSAKMIPTIIIPPTDQDLIHRSRADQSSARKSAREDTRPNESSRRKSADRPVSASRSTHKEKETPDKNKRTPIAKKKKKTSCKSRKSKAADMEDAPAEALASGDASQAPVEDASQPTANGLDVTGKVPDLPELSTSGKKNGRKGKKSGRRMMSPPPVGDKLRPPSELLDLDTNSRTGYDFGDMDSTDTETKNNKPRVQSLINTRMALSLKSSRFELPMDMKDLEKMCPQDYLRKFCVVSSRRLNLYQKVFVKHKDKTNHIKKDKLEMCLKETLVQSLKPNTFGDLCDLLEVDDATFIDFKLFSGIAAITERILYPFYTTEDTLEKPEYQRERIEAADFEALDWKLKGIEVKDKLRKLLKTIE